MYVSGKLQGLWIFVMCSNFETSYYIGLTLKILQGNNLDQFKLLNQSYDCGSVLSGK